MQKQFVTYEIALALKELGFEEECLALFDEDKELVLDKDALMHRLVADKITPLAPLWQQAQDFFREKYNLHIEFYYLPLSEKWGAEIYRLDKDILGESIDLEITYEEVREQAILKTIELCKAG